MTSKCDDGLVSGSVRGGYLLYILAGKAGKAGKPSQNYAILCPKGWNSIPFFVYFGWISGTEGCGNPVYKVINCNILRTA